MATLNDFFTELQQVNAHLQTLHNDMTAETAATNSVKTAVDQTNATLAGGFTALTQGLQVLATLQVQTNRFLAHKVRQEDTIICILEKVSKNTCDLVNEATVQTGVQTAIRDATDELRQLSESVNASAAVDFERLQRIRAELAACCPTEVPPPTCVYEPCPRPPRGPDEPSQEKVPQFVAET